jgi:hypothetical protein
MPFNLKSVKLFGILNFLFFLFTFAVLLQVKIPIGLTQISSIHDKVLKILIASLGFVLLLLAVQTLYCRGTGKLKVLLHITAGLSLLTLILTPLFWKSRTFYLYPESYVEIDGKEIGLTKLSMDGYRVRGNFFIEENGKKVSKVVSFNEPLISSLGMVWIRDVNFSRGMPIVEVQYSNFSIVPFLFVLLFGFTAILVTIILVK